MKSVQSFMITVIFLCLISFMFACDNNVSTAEISASIDPSLLSVRVGPIVSNGQYYIRVPLEVYGSESDLVGAGLDIYLNGGLIVSDIAVEDYYLPANGEIALSVISLKAGDKIGFKAILSDGGELYYEGIISADEEIKAALSILPTPSVNVSELQQFFEEMSTLSGSAEGETFSGQYDLQISSEYSEDCTHEFVDVTSFLGENKSAELIDSILAAGQIKESTVQILQFDGAVTWNNEDPAEGDYAGVINDDGTFTLFSAEYVDDLNYSYTLVQGKIETSIEGLGDFDGLDQHVLTANLTRVLVLDGHTLEIGAEGSCTENATITTK